MIFDTKWKRIYEKHREKIETMGYTEWITSPLDIGDFVLPYKYMKAIHEESEAFINGCK